MTAPAQPPRPDTTRGAQTGDDHDGRRTNRRARLTASATELFRRQGVHGTGVAAICETAGTTKGVFSHHFPGGKSEILSEVVLGNADLVERFLHTALATTASVAEAVILVFDTYADILDANIGHGCPMAAAAVDTSAANPNVRVELAEAFQRWQRIITAADTLETGGQSRPALAATAIAAMEGAILLARTTQNTDTMRSVGATISQLFRPHR